MQLMLRVLAIVCGTMSVPLMLIAVMGGRSMLDVAARGAVWIMLAVLLWSVAALRQEVDDAGRG